MNDWSSIQPWRCALTSDPRVRTRPAQVVEIAEECAEVSRRPCEGIKHQVHRTRQGVRAVIDQSRRAWMSKVIERSFGLVIDDS